MLNKTLFFVYVIYCFEVGIFLICFPWMDFWKQNLLLFRFPVLKLIFLNDFFRGAVSGLGVVNIILGISEITQFRRYFRKI